MTSKKPKKRLPLSLTMENYEHVSALATEDDPNWPSMTRVINKIISAHRKRRERRKPRGNTST